MSAANRAASDEQRDEEPADDHRHQHDEVEEPGVAPVERGEAQEAGGLLGVGGAVEQLLAAHGGADDDGAGHRDAAGLEPEHPAAERRPAGPQGRQHDERGQDDAGRDRRRS